MTRFIATCILICGGLATSAAAAPGYGLQPPGSFHGGEAVARQGERWLALRVRSGAAELLSARVAVKRVHDELLDGDGEATGEAVSAIGMDDVAMLLRGPGMKAGAVPLAEITDDGSPGALPSQHLRLGMHHYRLRTRCVADAANDSPGYSAHACTIELDDGQHRQNLVAMTGMRSRDEADAPMQLGDDASPHLIFAGDLDRDGRLDLIFDTSDHYNVARPVLFLSGAADAGELLHAVAEHEATGC